jgi:hypothetical protein
MFGRGGFPLVNQGFHPGYTGRGSFSGSGGGRHGVKGRPGGWAAQSRGAFRGHQGHMFGRVDSVQSRMNDSREQAENRVSHPALSASRDSQTIGRGNMAIDQGQEAAPGPVNTRAAGQNTVVSVGRRRQEFQFAGAGGHVDEAGV